MDHNGLYTDLDNFAGITGTSSATTTNNYNNDTCPTLLPSLNNFKYQQTSLSTNIYSNNIPSSADHQSTKNPSSTTTTLLPPTQININNCNNNIFFPLDDGLFSEPSQSIGTDRSGTTTLCPVATTNTNNHSGNSGHQQKNNFIGYLRKETGSNGGGGDNITYNINNINTNIVNNVVNNSDIFTGNQYHQISKPALGETIINFTNNNLNSSANSSMPVDTASATAQNYYGFQSTNSSNNNSNVQGQQQTSFETIGQTHQQQQQSSSTSQQSSTYYDASNMGLFHGNHLYQSQNSMSQKSGSFLSSAAPPQQDFTSSSTINLDQYHQDSLPATAKIINSFESKNPLKYPSNNRSSANYYSGKASAEYPPPPHQYSHLTSHPPHAYPNVYQNAKIPSTHNYPENYPPPRNSYPHPQHYATEERSPTLNRHHNYPPQSHPPIGPSNSNGYGFYGNGFNPISPHSHYPSPYPTQLQPPTSPYCSKPSPGSFTKSTMAPVDHGNFPLQHARSFSTSKKEFFQEPPSYYPPPPPPHHQMSHANFYENPKKVSSHRPKVIAPPPEMYKPAYNDHHLMPPTHPNNMRYQQMPKPPSFNGSTNYPPSSIPVPPQNSLDYNYHSFPQFPPYMNVNGKNGEHHKMPKMTSQQYHYDQMMSSVPPPHHMQPYRYHTLQAKPPEKIKISIDLEEQINSSKITKHHHNPAAYHGYGEYPGHHYYQQLHHPHHPNLHPQHPMMSSRSSHMMSDDMKSASVGSNINISLRDFLQTWNEIDDEDDGTRQHVVDDVERTIRREYNPMFIQKSAEHFPHHVMMEKSSSNVINEQQLSNDGSEKLYVLESIDVPLSELNKYKHLSVINKLPENVVIDKELYGDVDGSMKFIEDLTRGEKLYKSEFELEFEACQEGKIMKPPTIEESTPLIMSPDNVKLQKSEKNEILSNEEVFVEKVAAVEVIEIKDENETSLKSKKEKVIKVKVPKEKSPKILKLKKEKIMKDPRKFRITKRMKKYSLTSRTSSSAVKSLKSICIDFVNTSQYRNFARHQLSIINKHSKMRVLKDFKKKFNFINGGSVMKKPLINQKFNHSSARINSLTEICGKILVNKQIDTEDDDYDDDDEVFEEEEEELPNIYEVSSLKNICKQFLIDMNFDVVENDDDATNYLFTPSSLREICENFIYNNRQYFHIEEVNNVPKLQELCKEVLSNENIYVNFNQQHHHQTAINEEVVEEEPIYIVEENSGNVGELFESENLNSYEKTELLRKIQRGVANIEDDDEIMRAIGALHVDPIIDNNNECDVSNKNIQGSDEDFSMLNGDDMKFDSEMTFVSYLNDDLLHSVQYEEILNGNGQCTSNHKNLKQILRFKYLNRPCKQLKKKTIQRILKKSKKFKRKPLKKRRKSQLKNDNNESHDDAKDSQRRKKSMNIKNGISEAESNLPKLPSVLPSMNEYRIEKNTSNHRNNNIKDNNFNMMMTKKPRKMSFEESLLSIEKRLMSFEDDDRSKSRRRSSTSSSNSSHHHRHHHHQQQYHHRSSSHRSSRHRRRSHSRSRSKSKSTKQHHKSSRENCYKKDQIKHSEAKRLVIPSYKLYDKNLDIKLKTKPYVKIEREEKVDEMMRKLI